MKEMSTVEMQIADRARSHPDQGLTNLHQFIDQQLLNATFGMLNRRSAGGVDGELWKTYNEKRCERIPQLENLFKAGTYRAPAIRRVHIPKGDGTMRPLGIPTVEDKLLQTAVNRVLTPIYEQVFYDTSYGYRPGKAQHQAIDRLFEEVSFKGKRYIIDADMKNYFGSIKHDHLREFLDRKTKDGVIRKMIDKWLKAGVLEDGMLEYPTEGTPQGGTISPLLSNIYLHYVLDEWFMEQIQPLLKGESFLLRWADDVLIGFTHLEDARRVMEVLPKRLGKYGLTLHPEKTKLVELQAGRRAKGGTFTFLGFTHYMGRSRKGKALLKRKTSSRKLTATLARNNEWLKCNRHLPLRELINLINQKLRGHFSYYGITFNSRSLIAFKRGIERMLYNWLNRRGGRNTFNWVKFKLLIEKWMPLVKPRIYHTYQTAKP